MMRECYGKINCENRVNGPAAPTLPFLSVLNRHRWSIRVHPILSFCHCRGSFRPALSPSSFHAGRAFSGKVASSMTCVACVRMSKETPASRAFASGVSPVIAFPCPKCQATLKAPEEKVGARTKCPRCGCPVQVPDRPVSNPPTEPRDWRSAPPAVQVPDRPVSNPPVVADVVPIEELPSRSRRRRHPDDDLEPPRERGLSRCPYCRSTFPPLMKKKISPAGWVVFAAVLAMGTGMCVVGLCLWPLIIVGFVCLPLSILGILITTEERVCGECGAKFGG
jgi:hypothetical protein